MSAKEISAFALQLLGIVTAWPIIFLVIILIFRKPIGEALSKLADRLKKADLPGGTSFEFTDVRVRAFQDSVGVGIEDLRDSPDELVKFVKKQANKLAETFTSASQLPENRLALSGRSILWVDDSPLNIAYEESFCKQLGARIKQAISTEQALHYLT